MMSPLQKQAIFTKRVVLDEIFIFRDSVMPGYQLIGFEPATLPIASGCSASKVFWLRIGN